MITEKKYMISILTIFFIFVILISAQAEDSVIFSIIDPAGDDYGPGNYIYPQNKIFQSSKGLFDILEFNILDKDPFYEFQFKFTNLVDVWNSRYGFSLPLIEIYIDNEDGGLGELFEEGAQIRLNPEHPWNKLLKINGWWISLYTPEDRDKKVIDFTVSGDEVPWVLKNPDISVKDNWIYLKVEKDKIGPIKNSYLYILVGGFDPFGYDHFRGIREEPNSWYFSVDDSSDITYAPRVIDLVVSPQLNQIDILSNNKENYPQIEPIYTGKDNGFSNTDYLTYLILFLILALIVYLFENNIKKRSGVNNNVDKKEQKTD